MSDQTENINWGRHIL